MSESYKSHSLEMQYLQQMDYSTYSVPYYSPIHESSFAHYSANTTASSSAFYSNTWHEQRVPGSYTDINLTLLHYDAAMRILDIEQSPGFEQLASVLDCSEIHYEQSDTQPALRDEILEADPFVPQEDSPPGSQEKKKKKRKGEKRRE